MQVVVHMALGADLPVGRQARRRAGELSDAGGVATTAVAEGDPVGPKLDLQARLAEGAALISGDRYPDAAEVYEAAASLAEEQQDHLMALESWRMAAYCHEKAKQFEPAWRCGLKALDAGALLDAQGRAHSTLPYAGQELLRLAEHRPYATQADQVRRRLLDLLGPDWERKVTAGGQVMMLAAKHFDPVLGIDIHLIQTPASAILPIPHPFIGFLFDPFDYVPKIGATVRVNGIPRGRRDVGLRSHTALPDRRDVRPAHAGEYVRDVHGQQNGRLRWPPGQPHDPSDLGLSIHRFPADPSPEEKADQIDAVSADRRRPAHPGRPPGPDRRPADDLADGAGHAASLGGAGQRVGETRED